MAKLETLSKEQYDALSDELKTYYVVTKEGTYELEGIGELKRALAEEKAKKATKPELVTEIEELRKFKQDHEDKEAQAAQDLLVKQGEFEKAQEARDAEWQKRLDAATADRDSLFADVHRERLTNEIVKRGGLPDRAGYLVNDLYDATELVKGADGKYAVKKKGGIGDAAEFDAMFGEIKEAKSFFFAANGASGSGASGSDNGAQTGQQATGMNANQKLASYYAANTSPTK